MDFPQKAGHTGCGLHSSAMFLSGLMLLLRPPVCERPAWKTNCVHLGLERTKNSYSPRISPHSTG